MKCMCMPLSFGEGPCHISRHGAQTWAEEDGNTRATTGFCQHHVPACPFVIYAYFSRASAQFPTSTLSLALPHNRHMDDNAAQLQQCTCLPPQHAQAGCAASITLAPIALQMRPAKQTTWAVAPNVPHSMPLIKPSHPQLDQASSALV
jgi:hypothetical protein